MALIPATQRKKKKISQTSQTAVQIPPASELTCISHHIIQPAELESLEVE